MCFIPVSLYLVNSVHSCYFSTCCYVNFSDNLFYIILYPSSLPPMIFPLPPPLLSHPSLFLPPSQFWHVY